MVQVSQHQQTSRSVSFLSTAINNSLAIRTYLEMVFTELLLRLDYDVNVPM